MDTICPNLCLMLIKIIPYIVRQLSTSTLEHDSIKVGNIDEHICFFTVGTSLLQDEQHCCCAFNVIMNE
jgi:hypothetical protein